MLERLGEQRPLRTGRTAPFGLVLAPTRELALQVTEAITQYGRGMGARVLTVYGGAPAGPQLRGLSEGVDVVVATPGRAIDLMNRGALRLDELDVVVLDEADEMLDMGFVEDIETLLDATPDTRQGVLFSATMPRRIEDLARNYLREPVTVRMGREEVPAGESPLVRQTAYLVPRTHTTAALGRVLEAERPKAAIVFCRTRLDVDAVTETLTAPWPARRGTARRHGPGAPLPRRRAAAQRPHRAAGRHGRRRPRPGHRPAHARRQPRRAAVARDLRAPHRARRPGRPRGRRDHARAAVEDLHAAPDRAADPPAHRDRPGPHGRGPARRPAGPHP